MSLPMSGYRNCLLSHEVAVALRGDRYTPAAQVLQAFRQQGYQW